MCDGVRRKEGKENRKVGKSGGGRERERGLDAVVEFGVMTKKSKVEFEMEAMWVEGGRG